MGLSDNCVSATDQRAKEFFNGVETLLRQLFNKPLPHRLEMRARYDHQMVKNIQRILKQRNIIIRKTDKSKVFHLGSTDSYHQKSLEYMAKTNAYREIQDGRNPYRKHLEQVVALIDPLLKMKSIDLTIWKSNMYPRLDTIELAHLYFIPKPHKVN